MPLWVNGRTKTGGRPKGGRNKSTLAALPRNDYADALAYLEKVMTSTEATDTPELRLRAAVALAQYQRPRPSAPRGATLMTPIDYVAPKTIEEARALILELGERLARGEIPAELHDSLIAGLKVYLGDKAAEQEKTLARLEASLRTDDG